MQQYSSYFLHLVPSSVSFYGADLTIAQAFLQKQSLQGSEPLLKSSFVPYVTSWCPLAQLMEFTHAHLPNKWNSPVSRVARKFSYLFMAIFLFVFFFCLFYWSVLFYSMVIFIHDQWVCFAMSPLRVNSPYLIVSALIAIIRKWLSSF